jgi:RND family efflux transporter MFP subunit
VTPRGRWRVRWTILLLAAIAVALGYSVAARRAGSVQIVERGRPPALVSPSPKSLEAIGYLGVVLAQESLDVCAAAPGRLHTVLVQVGDRVRAGAVIAKLDTQALTRDVVMAEAALHRVDTHREEARLEVEQARDRSQRLQGLAREASAVSLEDLSSARYQESLATARLEGADATVREQRARVAQLRDALAEAELRAPFAGTIAWRHLEPGATVGRGDRVLRIISADDPRVRFAVPERDAAALLVGRPVSVKIDGEATEVSGEISRVAPDVDPPSQMVFVEAMFAKAARPKDTIVVGRTARVSVYAPGPSN